MTGVRDDLLPSTLHSGSILDVDARHRVPGLIYALTAASLTEAGFLIYATVLAARPLPPCAVAARAATAGASSLASSPASAARVLVYVAWAVLGTVALIVGGIASAALPDPSDEKAWRARCACCVACCLGGREGGAPPAGAQDRGGAGEGKRVAERLGLLFKQVSEKEREGRSRAMKRKNKTHPHHAHSADRPRRLHPHRRAGRVPAGGSPAAGGARSRHGGGAGGAGAAVTRADGCGRHALCSVALPPVPPVVRAGAAPARFSAHVGGVGFSPGVP